jgi:PAS domain S-box-containing protein
MQNTALAIRIVGAMVVTTIATALVAGTVLYRAGVENQEQALLNIARTAGALVTAIAENERRENSEDETTRAHAETIAQVQNAFMNSTPVGSSGEMLLITRQQDRIHILVHQTNRPAGQEHPPTAPDNSIYGQVVQLAEEGQSSTLQGKGLYGESLILAYSPVFGTPFVIIAEHPSRELIAPFIDAALLGAGIVLLISIAGAFLIYRNATTIIEETERSKQEAVEARRILRDALEASSEGFALYDRDDRLVVFNSIYSKLFETAETPIQKGQTFREVMLAGVTGGVFPEADGNEEEWMAKRLTIHLDPGTPIERRLSDGRWVRTSEHRTADGGIVGVHTDISDLKQKEIELRRSEARFRDFTESASDWVWETDSQHRFNPFDRSAQLESLFWEIPVGRTREEITSEDTTTPKWRAYSDDLAHRRPLRNFRYWVLNYKDEERLMNVSGVPVFDEDGTFLGYRGTGRDITRETRQVEKLRIAEERFRTAFQSITIGIVMSDQSGQIIAFNKAATRIFGYTPSEVIGKNVSMLAAGQDHVNHDSYISNYLDTGNRKIIGIGREVTGVRKNGETFPLFLGIAEMNVEGQTQFIASINDLSRMKALEDQLRQSQKMEAVGQLVGGIAHDFNNLLGIITGNLDLAQRKLEPGSKPLRQVTRALSAAERGAVLTRRLLNFSRQTPVRPEAVDVNDAIRDIHDLIQKSLTSAISINLDLEDDLPPALTIRGDLEDALVNLSINARDAMPDGGRLTIHTHLYEKTPNQASLSELQPGHYVRIDISDTGCGMSPAVAAKIFEPFFTTKETGKGTGLGLAMVYGFARRSSGLVTVHSEPDAGSTFNIYLPAAEGAADNGRTQPASEGRLPGGDETILIVDDEADLAEVTANFLAELGYETIVRTTPSEALELLKGNEKIDLLYSDVIMPGEIDGFELAARAEALRPGLAVCLTSGFTGNQETGTMTDGKNNPVLAKPVAYPDLANRVRQLLDGKSLDN